MGYGVALILTTFWAVSCWGTIIITGVQGASGFNPGNYGTQGTIVNTNTTTSTSTTPTLFAGAAGIGGTATGGQPNCASPSTLNADFTCNTCAGSVGLREACNIRAVYSTLEAVITFRSNSITGQARPVILDPVGGVVIATGLQNVMGPNQDATIRVPWQTLCTNVGSDSTCTTAPSGSGALTLGFDTRFDNTTTDQVQIQIAVSTLSTADNTIDYCGPPTNTAVISSGVCGFRAFPGDEKVYLIDLLPGTTFPVANGGASTNVQMNALMLFYDTQGFQFVTAEKPSKSFQIQINPNSTSSNVFDVSPNKGSGLENQVDYFFRLATVDQASNVAFFTSDAAIDAACATVDPTASTTLLPPLSDAALQGCPFVARPDKVNGLLTKDFNCFIASAAYGSVLDSRLKIFRAFRGSVLLSSKWGRQLNQLYYTYGPYGARFLNNNPWIKPPVRLALWPALLFAKLSLDVGTPTATLAMCLLLGVFVFAVFQLLQRTPRAEHQ